MKPSATILALICMGATATRSEWIYNRSTDPLTDDDVHVLLCSPTNTTRKIELTKPSALAINITNGKPVVAIIAVPEFTTEKTYPVTIRFDRKKARTIQCLISKDCDLLFPAKQREFAEEILASNGLIISLETAFGSRIDFFDLRGLDALLKKHNLKLFKTTPPPDPKLVSKAGAALEDIAQALAYADARTGTMPRIKSELTLTKPLKALKDAIAKKEQAASNFKTIEDRFNNLKPGNISRPSRAKLERARETLATAEKELASSVAEVRRLSLQILQTTDWPTPELSAAAKATANYIPRR